ncbi:MAG: hypothetical protein JWM17_246 [Actinobacteria bacterium]|nr:hypothetical protein [Actinomycetota bacterium]
MTSRILITGGTGTLRACGDDRRCVLEATELLCVNKHDNDGNYTKKIAWS